MSRIVHSSFNYISLILVLLVTFLVTFFISWFIVPLSVVVFAFLESYLYKILIAAQE